MSVITADPPPNRGDLTPAQLATRDAENWRAGLRALEVERTTVEGRQRLLADTLAAIESTEPRSAEAEVERIRLGVSLGRCASHLDAIADAIAAHKRAKP